MMIYVFAYRPTISDEFLKAPDCGLYLHIPYVGYFVGWCWRKDAQQFGASNVGVRTSPPTYDPQLKICTHSRMPRRASQFSAGITR
ncbi:hypothetical protein [Methyloglobulus sp.]|uniref:hypothetical protein n=1 Tax=Methyloglobulus sp. TaxID=2518622 RepID=UPI0039895831